MIPPAKLSFVFSVTPRIIICVFSFLLFYYATRRQFRNIDAVQLDILVI